MVTEDRPSPPTRDEWRKLVALLLEVMQWEGVIVIRIDGEKGSSLIALLDEDLAGNYTRAVLPALAEFLPDVIGRAYEAAGAVAFDTIDRMDPEGEGTG